MCEGRRGLMLVHPTTPTVVYVPGTGEALVLAKLCADQTCPALILFPAGPHPPETALRLRRVAFLERAHPVEISTS